MASARLEERGMITQMERIVEQISSLCPGELGLLRNTTFMSALDCKPTYGWRVQIRSIPQLQWAEQDGASLISEWWSQEDRRHRF